VKVAFLSSPYRGATEAIMTANKHQAWADATKLWTLGYGVICPVLNTAGMSGVVPEECFLEFYLQLIPQCDIVVVSASWIDSLGCCEENRLAHALNKPCFTIKSVPEARTL